MTVNFEALAAELDQTADAVSAARDDNGPWPHGHVQRILTRYGDAHTIALAVVSLADDITRFAPGDPYGWTRRACERMATSRLPVPWIAVDRALNVMRYHLTGEETEVVGGAEVADVILVLLMLRVEVPTAG